jgi:hypothetical protein
MTFSTDGSSLIILFDTSTNTPDFGYNRIFPCDLVAVFSSSNRAGCKWYNASMLIASLTGTSTNLPSPGDRVTVKGGIFQKQCLEAITLICQSYQYMTEVTMNLTIPSNAVHPSLVMSTTMNVGSCDDVVIDLTSSTGACSRPLVSFTWHVEGFNASIIAAYLSSRFNSFDSLVTIPNSLFTKGVTYYIQLTVTNFFGFTDISGVNIKYF